MRRGHVALCEEPHVLHVQQAHAGDSRRGGVDIAGNGDVDDQQRAAGTRPHRPFDPFHVQQCLRRRGRGEHDVHACELLVELRKADHLGARLPQGHGGPLGGAIRDYHPGGPARLSEGFGEPCPHLSGPHDEHRAALQASLQAVCCQGHGRIRERGRALGDPRLGTHALSRLYGVPEERPEDWARRGLLAGQFGCAADLAEDLAFP